MQTHVYKLYAFIKKTPPSQIETLPGIKYLKVKRDGERASQAVSNEPKQSTDGR